MLRGYSLLNTRRIPGVVEITDVTRTFESLPALTGPSLFISSFSLLLKIYLPSLNDMGSESRKQGEEFKRVRVAILGLVIAKADGLSLRNLWKVMSPANRYCGPCVFGYSDGTRF
jgi:hypothetical protein